MSDITPETLPNIPDDLFVVFKRMMSIIIPYPNSSVSNDSSSSKVAV